MAPQLQGQPRRPLSCSRMDTANISDAQKEMKVGVVGLGYVGLPLAVAFAEADCGVVALDVDPLKVSAVAAGDSYIEDVSVRAASRGAAEDPRHLPLRGPGAGRCRDHLRSHPADRQPRAGPGSARRRGEVAGAGAPARPAGRARVDDVSGHDARAADAAARGLRPARRRRRQPRVLARARRSRAAPTTRSATPPR